MKNTEINETSTWILFNDRNCKNFADAKTIKRLLGASNLRVFSRTGRLWEEIQDLIDALRVQKGNISSTTFQFPKIECNHLISISGEIKRNVFFDTTFGDKVVGSFTATDEDVEQLNELMLGFKEVLNIFKAPESWIEVAKQNSATLKRLNLVDPTVIDFNNHYLSSVSDTYGLQALKMSQTNIIKWVEDHRWKYID